MAGNTSIVRSEFGAVRSVLTGGESSGVVLVGAAGVGKTTLARAVTDRCARKCTGWPPPNRRAAFRSACSRTWSGHRRHATPPRYSRRHGNPCRQENTASASTTPTCSTNCPRHCCTRSPSRQAGRILATVRTGEPVPDAVTSLWKDGYLRRIELQPFTKQQSVALVETVIGGSLEGLSADLMWESSGGNPLFLRHLVEGSIDAGTLTRVNDVWQLRGPTAVPSGLAALLETGWIRRAADVVNALKLLALCEPLDIDALTELAGEDAVDTAEASGLIRFTRDGVMLNARFSHPLVGDVVRSALGTAAARTAARHGSSQMLARPLSWYSAAARIRMAQLSIDSDQAVGDGPADHRGQGRDLPVQPAARRAARPRRVRARRRPAGGRAAVPRTAVAGPPAAGRCDPGAVRPRRPRRAAAGAVGYPPGVDPVLVDGRCGTGPRSARLRRARRRASRACNWSSMRVGAAMAVHENKIDEGIAAAEAVLADPHAPKQAVEFAAFGAGLAMPVAGRGDEFEPIAARCRAEQKATDGMIRVMVRYCDVLALTHTRPAGPRRQARSRVRQLLLGGPVPGMGDRQDQRRRRRHRPGRLPRGHHVHRAGTGGAGPPRPRCRGSCRRGCCWPARTPHSATRGEAERVLDRRGETPGPSMAMHEPQRLISKAWLAAAKGMERRAVELARASRRQCASRRASSPSKPRRCTTRPGSGTAPSPIGWPSFEDRSRAAWSACRPGTRRRRRLRCRRAGRGQRGIRGGGTAAVRRRRRRSGGRRLHDSAGDRRQSNGVGRRALRLAERCGGATTPAIKAAARPLPLTAARARDRRAHRRRADQPRDR